MPKIHLTHTHVHTYITEILHTCHTILYCTYLIDTKYTHHSCTHHIHHPWLHMLHAHPRAHIHTICTQLPYIHHTYHTTHVPITLTLYITHIHTHTCAHIYHTDMDTLLAHATQKPHRPAFTSPYLTEIHTQAHPTSLTQTHTTHVQRHTWYTSGSCFCCLWFQENSVVLC